MDELPQADRRQDDMRHVRIVHESLAIAGGIGRSLRPTPRRRVRGVWGIRRLGNGGARKKVAPERHVARPVAAVHRIRGQQPSRLCSDAASF